MEVIWSELAKESLYEVICYVYKYFGEVAARRIRNMIILSVDGLTHNPEIGTLHSVMASQEEVRYIRVKKSKIFYTQYEEKLVVLLVWDMRRNPQVLEKLLRQGRDDSSY
jgi:plasmid stabilization system protein ParE